MRRAAAGILSSLLAITLLGAAPARAGSVVYVDPAGDATAIHGGGLPRPSDPQLDLLEVRWATTADEVVVTTKLEQLGEPVVSHGWAVAHYFEYEGLRFELLGQQMASPSDQLFGSGVYLRPEGDSQTEYPCVCRLILRPEDSSVTIHMELHSLGSAARTVDPRTPRPSPGSALSELRTVSYRALGVLLSADTAAPPEGTQLGI